MDFCLLLKLQVKNIGKDLNKNLSGKNSQKGLDNDKQSATDAFNSFFKKSFLKKSNSNSKNSRSNW